MQYPWINHNEKEYMYLYAAAAAKSLQSCPTLCDPIDSSPPGSAVPGMYLYNWVILLYYSNYNIVNQLYFN